MVQSARLSVLVGIITMGVTAMRTDINSIGRDQLMQAAANASTACQGFAGYQGQLAAKDNTFEIVSSQKDCCCATQRLIE